MQERLKSELAIDPLSRGYSGMTDAEALADLQTPYRSRSRDLIPSYEVMEAVDDADLSALSAVVHRKLMLYMGVEFINISNQRVRNGLAAIFSGRTAMLVRLTALENEPITRELELQLGTLRLGHIQVARV